MSVTNADRSFIRSVLELEKDVYPQNVQEQLGRFLRKGSSKPVIYIGITTGSISRGAEKTREALLHYLEENGIEAEVVPTGCGGYTTFMPQVGIFLPAKNGLYFRNITADKVEELLNAVFHNDIPQEDLLGQVGEKGYTAWPGIRFFADQPYRLKQRRLVLEHCAAYNPESIEEAIALGTYRSFLKTIRHYTYEEVCDIVERSGLRGRSGGGFSTGEKWKHALNAQADQKYIVCNARESDPGAFTDRSIIESDPHRLIEGMGIAAYAIGARKGFIYVRMGFDLGIQRLRKAIEQAREYGILGHNIFQSGFSLDIEIRQDPGAFVCGEETALIASLEGRRGMPSLKPPYPATSGLQQKPTLINNVETLCNIPPIMKNGPEWFRSMGTEESPGTKIFALSGKGRLSGLVEVEMGTPLKDLVFELADGIRNNTELKAVHLGGPQGSLIPPPLLETPVTFEDMEEAGIVMGAGGMVIIDEQNCIVDMVRYFMEFIRKESCGKCIPCREGTSRMLEILEGIVSRPADSSSNFTLERFKGVLQLENIAGVMKDTSLCGLGQSAPNPFISALKYFRDEFEEHIFDRNCRSNVCKGLRIFSIDVEKCTGCTVCAGRCPVQAIYGTKLKPYFIVEERCIGCGICQDVCKFDAVYVK